MAFSHNVQVIRDGYRNYVLRLTGECLAGDADQTPTLLVNVSALNPPCKVLRIDRVKYSLPHGSPLDVQLYWDATAPELVWGMSGGDDSDFWNFGGITNNLPAGYTGNLLWGTSGASSTVAGSGTVLTFAVIIECVKLQVQYPM